MAEILIHEDANCRVWRDIRPDGSGTERYEIKPGSVVDNAVQIEQRLVAALDTNRAYLAIASPTAAQTASQVRALTREVNGLVRLALGRFDDTTGT